jgi:hypothetical protein
MDTNFEVIWISVALAVLIGLAWFSWFSYAKFPVTMTQSNYELQPWPLIS